MSEYWKSTPKYWCKNCSTYVRDTAFERKQHESTAKHQNNLKRFLREIQNDHERSEREKQKAKHEVERLNRITGTGSTQPAVDISAPGTRKSTSTAMTAADQKRQWSQLSEMGIQVPDTFRGSMAMASNWQTMSKSKRVAVPEEDSLSKGIRKRKVDEEEEEEQVIFQPRRKVWGKSTKIYPGQINDDLDELLSSRLLSRRDRVEVKEEPSALFQSEENLPTQESDDHRTPPVTGLEGDTVVEGKKSAAGEASNEGDPQIKTDPSVGIDVQNTVDDDAAPMPVFKKRKGKTTNVI